jgi:ubiquinone/menaquinone biosynthesis C-methylase UbiE
MKRIRVRQKHNWFARLFIVVLLTGLWRVYSRRLQERIPSVEGIEDDEIAAAYAWVTRMPQMHWIRRLVISQATVLQDRGEAADLGCGAGQLVMELARKAPGLHVTGIDLSETMLADARQSAQQAGLEKRVDFRLGNVEQIPFPDQSVDLVISTVSLHHWADPVKVLNEIDRVLQPGGAYYIFDLRRDLYPPFYLLIWFATQFIVPTALHQANEPMGSRNASYTAHELAGLAQLSRLQGGQVTSGPLWVVLAGKKTVAE